jgi:calpain-7
MSFIHVCHAQAQIEVASSTNALSIIGSYDGSFGDVGFTVTAYSPVPILWDETVPKAPYTENASGLRCVITHTYIYNSVF